jgi:2-iminobutanoate/2-iminopropanoate deaminase
MPRYLNPPTVPGTAGRYSQGVLLGPHAKRLIISGQVGRSAEGVIAQGLEAQAAQAIDNILAVVQAAGMEPSDIVKLNVFCTQKGGVSVMREVRLQKLGRHAPASTYVEVASLADPAYLLEIEGEAVREAEL